MSAFDDALMSGGPQTPPPAPSPDPRAGAINPHPVVDSPPPGGAFDAALSGATTDEAPKDTGPAPDWADIPRQAASNIVPSGTQFLGNMAHAVMHPVESAENLGSAGLGYMEKAGRHLGLPSGQGYEKYADAINQMVMDRYGSVDNFKKTLANDPVGALADFSAVLTGGGGALGRLPGVAGKIGEVASTAGSIVDPMNAVAVPAKAALKGAGVVAREAFGHRLGTGPEAIGEAAGSGFSAGPLGGGDRAADFRGNIRGNVPIESVVDTAMDAMHNIVADKNSGWKQGIAEAGLDKPISQTSFNQIRKAVYDASDIGRFKGWQYDKGAAKANDDLRGIFADFLSQPHLHTVEGLDALKQAIYSYKKENNLSGSKAGIVADTYAGAIKNAIVEQAPKYAKVMDNYGEAKDLLNDLQKSFSLPADQRKMNTDTALRKLQSVMRNNANTNYGYRNTLLKSLEENGAPNIRTALAGQALSSGSPRGLARISVELGVEIANSLMGILSGNPGKALSAAGAAILTAATSSPRLVGETAYYGGRGAKLASKVINRPVARVLNQTGRIDQLPAMQQSRGGAIDRATRMSKHKEA